MGFPSGANDKEPACQCRRCKKGGFDPWVRMILWRMEWQSTPVLLPGEPQGQRSLAGYSPYSHKGLGMTEATEYAPTLTTGIRSYM